MRIQRISITILCLAASCVATQGQTPFRLAIAGLVHGHVEGLLKSVTQTRKDARIVGIYEPNIVLARAVAKRFGLPQSLFYTNLETMLDKVKPEALATFTSTYDHTAVVEAAGPRRVAVMVEKPLAIDVEHARRMQKVADRYGIAVLVNYETTWFASTAALWENVREQKALGEIRRMVAIDGDAGPKQIGVDVGSEFFGSLTDPARSGAGALYDFGCYGASLMTWLKDGQRPVSVTAVTRQFQPSIYPHVDDDATVLLEYPRSEGVIEASWDWPTSRKEFEIYGERGYAIATGATSFRTRVGEAEEQAAAMGTTPDAQGAAEHDPISYLIAVARGKKPGGLSSLENNVIVTEILDAARESARTGRKVVLR